MRSIIIFNNKLKIKYFSVILIVLCLQSNAYSSIFAPFDFNSYINQGKNIFIGEVLCSEKHNIYVNAITRRIEVKYVLTGKFKEGDQFDVSVIEGWDDLEVGHVYLFHSHVPNLNDKGELYVGGGLNRVLLK